MTKVLETIGKVTQINLVTPQRSKYAKQQDSSIDTSQFGRDKFILLPATYILKTDKHKKQHDDCCSKIARRLSSKNIASCRDDDRSSKQPMLFIKCTPAPKGPRITQCSTKISKDKTNYSIHLESQLKKGSAYKISRSTDSSKSCVKKPMIPCKGALSKRKSKPEVTPGKADLKIDILFSSEMKDPLSRATCKDGFDPFKPSSLKKLSRDKKQICSSGCCQPVLALDAKPSPIERCTMQKRLDSQRLPSKQILRAEIVQIESAKSDKALPCQKSALKRAPEISRDTLDLPSLQELIARYGNDIPIYQLEKYEACRNKRNGLQDECIPPLLRAILKREEQERTLEKCSKGEQSSQRSVIQIEWVNQ
ncbi:hypothetical protein ALC56_00119 [Trachymyrmex septentrionalis]|uniref:Uncharacterized protein n=1 Tax=Trachymyrmex septentrionalis TaxID=34720 RepID=A0A195FXM6_9HYME|nr:PREDICTED: uncharacterized protein LOC108752887 [Trachymyrmex septentrionalis]KYN45425.1 hypothetical protein ALC56_00119 [Trachymyrmex septentrionalis]